MFDYISINLGVLTKIIHTPNQVNLVNFPFDKILGLSLDPIPGGETIDIFGAIKLK